MPCHRAQQWLGSDGERQWWIQAHNNNGGLLITGEHQMEKDSDGV